MTIGSADGALIGTIVACETAAGASGRQPTYYEALQLRITGWHWPAMAGSGAADGNRKYRPRSTNLLKSNCYQIARAARAIFV
jgi:hypothetical protein